MSGPEPAPERFPASYPATGPVPPRKRRAAFSRGFAALESHHADPPSPGAGDARRERRVHADDSLRLIEDLTNRPVDPMFSDSRLTKGPRSKAEAWATRVVVFLVCIAVGLAGTIMVRQLNTDPRKPVRASLASQLAESSDEVARLSREVDDLQTQIVRHTDASAPGEATTTLAKDNMAIGLTAVHGGGLVVTLANPLSAATGGTGTGAANLRVVTDQDLQQIVMILWQAGAEAIAVNGHRLGPGTAIRAAGDLILVGLDSIESPYVIEAIGPGADLANALSRRNQPELHQAYERAGIGLQTKLSPDITLQAAVSGELQYAKEED